MLTFFSLPFPPDEFWEFGEGGEDSLAHQSAGTATFDPAMRGDGTDGNLKVSSVAVPPFSVFLPTITPTICDSIAP